MGLPARVAARRRALDHAFMAIIAHSYKPWEIAVWNLRYPAD